MWHPRWLIIIYTLFLFFSSSVALLLDAVQDSLPPLTLRPQQPNFSFDLTSALPPAYITLSQDYDPPPPSCNATSECSAGMTVLSVYFEDCGDPFTVCRCGDATMSMDTVLDRLGRVPVGLRRYMGVMVVLAGTEPHAFTLTNGDIHLFGDCAMDTWVHEMMHAYDFAGRTVLSSSSDWAAALRADSCVPDNYSLTNQVEDFAQVGVIKTYMVFYGGQLPPGFTADCMENQLQFMDAVVPLFRPDLLFGNTCDIVDGGPAARHTASPTMLDLSRTFRTMSPVATGAGSWSSAAPTARAGTAGSKIPGSFLLSCVIVLAAIAFARSGIGEMRLWSNFILTILPFSLAFPLISLDVDLATRDPITDPSSPALSLQPQQPDFSSFDLTSALPPAYLTQSEGIDLPPNCAAYVGEGQECASDMTALSVHFEDCGDEFIVCRCSDAEMSMDTVLDRFGRVPVGLRRYAGTVVVLPDTAPHAYTVTTGDTHFFGDCEMNTWVHEMTHAFDFATATWQSSASGWAAAIEADSCVPDVYSLKNEMEDFAQVGVIMIYMQLYGGNLPPGFTADCMSNQLAFMLTFELYDPGPLFGNNCDIIDTGPPARHTLPPAVLDPSRVFQSLSPDDGDSSGPTSVDGGAAAAPTNRAGPTVKRPTALLWAAILTLSAWVMLP
ncbi:hypothetical protein B0H13DRAFT_2671433 [Mycena leptocephala]|nr:hypothetical protein B0H13DRAFT_2671433 [Mycena leptocephala]